MKNKYCLSSFVAVLLCFVVQTNRASAQGILFYPRTDGAVVGVDIGTSNVVKTISAAAFVGANPGAGRSVAYDPVTRLMWYSSTDGQLYSAHIDTLEAGPSITGIPGANPGAGRHLFIDYKRRNLWTPLTDGSVEIYSLATQTSVGSLPSNFFTDGNVGGFRHFASDQRSGVMWYAATDGSFIEMNPDTATRTGRVIPFSAQIGADPGAFRHMVVDPLRNLLLYSVTDGSVASINLSTLTAGPLTISSGAFPGGNNGAGRTLTYDLQAITFTPVFNKAGNSFAMSWNNLGSNYTYTVQFRNDLSTGSWAPVPPLDQWPTSATSLNNFSAVNPRAFFRLIVHPPASLD